MSSQDLEGTANKGIGAAEDAANAAVGRTGARVKDEARNFADKSSRVTQGAKDALGRAADQARSAASTAADTYADLRGRAQAMSDAVDPFVRNNPYGALALGVVGGLVLGALVFGRPQVVYVRPRT